MTFEEKFIKIAENQQKVFDSGKAQGTDITQLPQYYMNVQDYQWQNVAFPEGFDFVLKIGNAPRTLNGMVMSATGVKTVKLICDVDGEVDFRQAIKSCRSIQTFDISDFKPIPKSIAQMAMYTSNLVSIFGTLDMSSCTDASNAFNGAAALENITIGGVISVSLDMASCKKLIAESYHSIMTHLSKTATITLTLPAESTVRNCYDAKYGSGAWNNIVAEYDNVTIVYK